ncbi:MBL fold metallo-hydrolase [Patescibacteria group bacterium]
MHVVDIEVGNLRTNCYLVSNENELIIIDPGDDGKKITKVIKDSKLEPKLCLLTHGHFDHVLALVEIIKEYQIPLLVNQKDTFLLKESIEFEKIERFIKFVDKESKVDIGNATFRVIETPGHTPGSISLYCEKEKAIFVGDLIFAGGFVGRTDFEYGSELILNKSIKKVLEFSPATVVYPGHGPSFVLSEWMS